MLQEQLSYFSTGNHTAASWGYGKGGKGGRHLIPLKWASKMSYHTNLKGGREMRILLRLGLLQYKFIHKSRVYTHFQADECLQNLFLTIILITLMENVIYNY